MRVFTSFHRCAFTLSRTARHARMRECTASCVVKYEKISPCISIGRLANGARGAVDEEDVASDDEGEEEEEEEEDDIVSCKDEDVDEDAPLSMALRPTRRPSTRITKSVCLNHNADRKKASLTSRRSERMSLNECTVQVCHSQESQLHSASVPAAISLFDSR